MRVQLAALRRWVAATDVVLTGMLVLAGLIAMLLAVVLVLRDGALGGALLACLAAVGTLVTVRQRRLMRRLRHDASHDPLTGLANRRLLLERLDRVQVPSGSPDGTSPAVLLLGLDRFKEVNEAFGHPTGDELLQVVGSRLGAVLPAAATLARVGSDEFAVLMPAPPARGTLDPAREPEAAARRLALGMLAALTPPVALPMATVRTRASVGVALGRPGLSGVEMLRQADTALSAAKAAGGDERVIVHRTGLDQGRGDRMELLADLHLALERDELEMRYQPQLDLASNRIVSVEALVRWRHPHRGLLAPDAFIALAESAGLIDELTRQVLGKALRQVRQWRDAGLDLAIAVNLSAQNVNNVGLADDVAAALAEAGVPANRLVLELTETSVMGDPGRTVPILRRLADLGVALSLDDFGTGYSSLAYLQKLPVREVKIDKSFVTGLSGGDEARASEMLVRSILTLGGNLGLRMIAEGVEDADVLEQLRPLGCDLAQGYHIARPLPAADLAPLLTRLTRAA